METFQIFNLYYFCGGYTLRDYVLLFLNDRIRQHQVIYKNFRNFSLCNGIWLYYLPEVTTPGDVIK